MAPLTRTAKFTYLFFRLNLSTLSYSSTHLLLRDEVSAQVGKCAPIRVALHGARAEDGVTEKHELSEM